MSTSYHDLFSEEVSDCCGAAMYSNIDICSDCKEHCSSTIEMEEAEREFLPIAGIEFDKKAFDSIKIKKND